MSELDRVGQNQNPYVALPGPADDHRDVEAALQEPRPGSLNGRVVISIDDDDECCDCGWQKLACGACAIALFVLVFIAGPALL